MEDSRMYFLFRVETNSSVKISTKKKKKKKKKKRTCGGPIGFSVFRVLEQLNKLTSYVNLDLRCSSISLKVHLEVCMHH